MRTFCCLARVPKWVRLFLGWMLIAIGLPLLLTPIPGGILLSVTGAMLLFCASPFMRTRLGTLIEGSPMLARRLAPLFDACRSCLESCRKQVSTEILPSQAVIPDAAPPAD